MGVPCTRRELRRFGLQQIVVYGSGGFAREVHQVVCDINAVSPTWDFLGFLDDNPDTHGSRLHDYPILGDEHWLSTHPGVLVVVGIGNTRAKRTVAGKVVAAGSGFATLIHPRAWLGQNIDVGTGTVICAGVTATCDIAIGAHVIINLDCTVGHDATIADFTTIAPSTNISGDVHVGEGCDLGTSSTVIQGVNIGEWTIVGAGTVVVRDLVANVTAVGIPAKVIKQRAPGWHL